MRQIGPTRQMAVWRGGERILRVVSVPRGFRWTTCDERQACDRQQQEADRLEVNRVSALCPVDIRVRTSFQILLHLT